MWRQNTRDDQSDVFMDLSRSRDAFGTPAFAEALAGQLREHTPAFPVERACESGGWPTDIQVGAVCGVADDGETIRADVTISIVELVAGCSGSPQESPRLLHCRVTIRKSDGSGQVEVLDDAG